MRRRNRGYSLIEALVSLLVLSFGLLGIARLQATLWVSSGAIHATAEAYALSTNLVEQNRASPVTGTGVDSGEQTRTFNSGTEILSGFSMVDNAGLQEITVSTRWEDRIGVRRIRLVDALPTDSTAPMTRWLLPRTLP